MNYGYQIRYTSESTTNPDYNMLRSMEYPTTSEQPLFTVNYGYTLPSALTVGTVYSFLNAGSKKYLDVCGGTDADNNNVAQYKGNSTVSQDFKLEQSSTGNGYILRAQVGGKTRVLDIYKTNGRVENGNNVQIYRNVNPIAQEWLIVPISDTYYKIMPRSNPALALTSYGSADGSATGKSTTSAGNVFVSTYTGNNPNQWWRIERENGNGWLLLNFEAVKRSPPTEIDPRSEGEPLWGERHSTGLLAERMKLDPLRFECMYQGHPSAAQGLLYGDRFMLYEQLPETLVRYANYTDTADTGDDYLCSVCYAVDAQRRIYVTEVVYSREGMEVTEEVVAAMLQQVPGCDVLVESNNGGRGFARAVSRLCPNHRIGWFCQSANKEARILSNASAVLRNICMPVDWVARWPEFAHDLLSYRRIFRTNRWHDAPDVLTGIAEREICGTLSKKIRALSFKR